MCEIQPLLMHRYRRRDDMNCTTVLLPTIMASETRMMESCSSKRLLQRQRPLRRKWQNGKGFKK